MLSEAEEEVFPAGVLYTCGAEGGAVEGCEFDGPWLGVSPLGATARVGTVAVGLLVFRRGLGLVTDVGEDIGAKRLTVNARYGGVLTQCTHAGASKVKLVDCKLRGGDFGVALRHASDVGLKLRNSTVWDCGVGIGVGADHNMLILKCEGAVTRVVIENVSVKRCAQSGLAVCAHRHVVAKRLRAVRCGIVAVGVAERSRFEDCTVTKGDQGTLALLTGSGGEQVSAALPGVRVVPEGVE
eukprot:jgi/Ulvmu1/1019/UM104_0004.1